MTTITANNYSTATSNINFSDAPSALKDGNVAFQDLREFYNEDAGIKETIDLYIAQLNKWVASHQEPTKEKRETTPKKAKPVKAKVENEVKTKNTPTPKKEPVAKKVKTSKKAKATKKAKVKRVVVKAAIPKAIKTSRIKSPELVLIQGFLALNKRSLSIKSFETKLAAAKHLETVNHKYVIDLIKGKLQHAIVTAKEDSSNNGKITATIEPEFFKKCKETIKNGIELLRVSYIGEITHVNKGVKPSRKLRPVKRKADTYTDATGKGAGSHHGGLKKKR